MKKNEDIEIDKEIRALLDSYTIHSSLNSEKEKTLHILKDYLPIRKKANKMAIIMSLLEKTVKELISACKFQYGIMILLSVVLLPLVNVSTDSYLVLFFTAPIPLFIGFWNVYGRGDHVLIELEKTFKYTYYQILCARIVTITGASIVFLSFPIATFVVMDMQIQSFSLFKLIVWGLTPIFTFSVILLFIASLHRENNFFTTSLFVWGIFGYAAISTPIGRSMLHLNTFVYILLLFISVALLLFKMIRILKTDERRLQNV